MNEQLKIDTQNYLIPFINRLPVAFVRAKKHYLYDTDGKRYIDFTAGIATVNLGHSNPKVNRAVKKQIDRIVHISNLYIIPQQAEASKLISEKSFKGKSFFVNSGAEANETALKISRYLAQKKFPNKNRILALTNSFHGRTIATVTLTGQEKYRHGFEPLLPRIDHVTLNDLDSLGKKFDHDVAAIFFEPILGEGGIIPITREFANKMAELARQYDVLLISDEVQTGIGRSGKYFGYQSYDLEPDIITLAKALGNGFPVGAVHIRDRLAQEIPLGLHMSTFGGNYVAMAAAIAVLKQLNPKLLRLVTDLGEYFFQKAIQLKQANPNAIGDIRVKGLMIGIDLIDLNVNDVINKLLQRGICVLKAGENTLRLEPPFTITKKEIDFLFRELSDIL